MFQKLVSALVFPCGNQMCESRMCGVRNNKLQLSDRSAEPNYTHQNLQSEASAIATSAHRIRVSSKSRICLKAVKTIQDTKNITKHYCTKQVLCKNNNFTLQKSV